jgi:hypothetical protein
VFSKLIDRSECTKSIRDFNFAAASNVPGGKSDLQAFKVDQICELEIFTFTPLIGETQTEIYRSQGNSWQKSLRIPVHLPLPRGVYFTAN